MSVVDIFLKYQEELDLKHEKQERLVKLSRDVTIQSKKVIFQIHRHFDEKEDAGENKNEDILREAQQKLDFIRSSLIRKITEEIQFEDVGKFHKSYSSGIQEYLEAVMFLYYKKNGRLVSFAEVQKDLIYSNDEASSSDKNYLKFPLSVTDYVLSIADLTGELMRQAVTVVSNGNTTLPFLILHFLRDVQTFFLGLKSTGNYSCKKELSQKLSTLNECVTKVERVCFHIRLRGSEYNFKFMQLEEEFN
ncbi:PREDICTED: translin-associated protein X-like [Amphimedon queenslandica]|uniref:Translin-associated protein X n=1 Tax=Amphimedon queenslandica TaxID=400682 RepID=A0A1X7V5K0_AMPQE|nr:PREDICTED: translin-associated protein X-like [Amphimedon queenslandica]|eukprot:XP_003385585.1 PREDICTED: translin-associated protein X-like [Amphimedon queenslandica]